MERIDERVGEITRIVKGLITYVDALPYHPEVSNLRNQCLRLQRKVEDLENDLFWEKVTK